MAASVKALVKAELLVWARTSAHVSMEEAARKAQVKEKQLQAWESGEGQPSIAQLRKLGRVYKRPLAVFFLPKPPKTFDTLRDFRRLPQDKAGTQSPELAFEIRRARARREIALDLHLDLFGEEPKPFSAKASVDEDPEEAATRLRKLLGIERSESSNWSTLHDALNRWRGALEEVGVLVFQAEDVEVSEMRGFSISARVYPVAVINIKDAVAGRIFSMLHETSHLMLREGGLCDFEEGSRAQGRVEVFCNRVAAAALMPAVWLLQEDVVHASRGSQWGEDDIMALAQRYRVSREALLRSARPRKDD